MTNIEQTVNTKSASSEPEHEILNATNIMKDNDGDELVHDELDRSVGVCNEPTQNVTEDLTQISVDLTESESTHTITETDSTNLINAITSPSTPTKIRSTFSHGCGCVCDCWKREDYPSLAPRKTGYKEGTGQNRFVAILACKHFASCHLSGTTCASV